ncbi:hypothetical protein G5B41_07900 [bacterium SGD-2]|nr:hypothetical protein [bacterium SGD-2]
MNHINRNVMLTDELERKLIQQEIDNQMSFAPLFDGKGIVAKIAELLGYTRAKTPVSTETRIAH